MTANYTIDTDLVLTSTINTTRGPKQI